MKTTQLSTLTKRSFSVALTTFLVGNSLVSPNLWAADKKIFTRTADVRPNNPDALLDVFKPISEEFENPARALDTAFTAGELLYQQRRFSDALRNFNSVVNEGKKNTFQASSAKLRMAETYMLSGDYDAALNGGRDVASSDNKFLAAEAWYVITRAYLCQGKLDRADEAYKNILTVNPTYGTLLKIDLLSGLIAFQKGSYLDAVTHFQRHAADVPSLYYAIASYCQLKDIAKAVSAYQSLLGQAKKGVWVDRARVLIGEAIYQSKDYDLAMTFFGPVSRKDALPSLRVLALYRLACIDFAKKNYTRSELTLQDLLKQYDNHPLRTDWMYLLATIPVYQRDWSRTIREEGRYTSAKGGNSAPHSLPANQLIPEAEFRVIWAYMALGSYGEVVKRSNRFYQRYPKNALTSYALLLQGVAYDQLADLDKAIASYQTLVDLFPSSPAAGKAVYLMTLSLHKANEPSRIVSALNHMNESILRSQELKSDEWRKNTLFWIAEGYYSIKDWPHAEETYLRFIELAPESTMTPYALQGLAATLSEEGQLDKAKIYAQQAIQRSQELGLTAVGLDAKLQLGKILFNQKSYDGALAQFDAYVQDSTNTVRVAEALYQSGLALYNQDYFTEAIARWKRVTDTYRLSPYRPQAYLQTGRTRFGLGQYDQAVAAFQALAANYPNTPEAQEAQFQIIMSYFNKRDLRSAFQQFAAFKNAYPSDERISTACEQLLEAYRAQGTQSGSLHSGELSELLRACPAKNVASNILWERGAALFNKKDYAAAQKYFQRIMLSYPSDEVAPQAYFYNAEAYFFLGNMDLAASAYKSFYINYPNDKMVPQAMFQVGVSFFNKKDYAKAAEAFNDFIKRFPQHQLAKDAALNVALCHKKAFKLDEAIKSYQNYLTLFPGDAKGPFILLQIGSLLVTKGQYAEAIDQLEKVPSGTVEKLEAQYHIGESYTNMHKDDLARAAYERLAQMGPKDNEFRCAGLLELAKLLETKGSSNQALTNVYSEISSSCKNAELANMAQMKLKELKGGN